MFILLPTHPHTKMIIHSFIQTVMIIIWKCSKFLILVRRLFCFVLENLNAKIPFSKHQTSFNVARKVTVFIKQQNKQKISTHFFSSFMKLKLGKTKNFSYLYFHWKKVQRKWKKYIQDVHEIIINSFTLSFFIWVHFN